MIRISSLELGQVKESISWVENGKQWDVYKVGPREGLVGKKPGARTEEPKAEQLFLNSIQLNVEHGKSIIKDHYGEAATLHRLVSIPLSPLSAYVKSLSNVIV
jgi:hypothetical protein